MPIDKLIPQYLNLDDDERLIKNVEMTDAQNIRTSVDSNGQSLILKNAYGNVLRSADDNIVNGSMPAGTNITIGAVASSRLGYLYYFVYNGNANHTILRYDETRKKAYIVYQDNLLQWSSETRVIASVVEATNGDVLLYFTDGNNSPKKINATVAEQSFTGVGGYPATFTTGTVSERLLYVTLCKQPPQTPPVITFENDPSIPRNDLFEKNFQFSYQYIYRDGEESALSPYSQLSVSTSQLKDGFINQGQRNFYNRIRVTVNNNKGDVSKIRVYGRLGNEGAFYLIKEINNNQTGGTSSVTFTNDQSFLPLSTEVQDKVYDNVPQKADSLAIANGRLFLGGYTDGYPNIDTEPSRVLPNYTEKAPVYNVVVSSIEGYPAESGGAPTPASQSSLIQMDFSGLPANITEDSKVFINFAYDFGRIRLKNDLGDNDNYRWMPSTATVNYMKELSGLRFNTGTGFVGIGDSTKGTLNAPPTIFFTKRKDTSDSNVADISLARVRKGIKLITSGVQVRKVIDIPANTSRWAATQIVVNAITGNYPFFARPQDGLAGFSTVTTSGDTWAEEQVAFKGKGFARIKGVDSNQAAVTRTLQVKIEKLTLQVDKMISGTKPCDVISPEADISRFDFIEGVNSKNQDNRIRANAPYDYVSNGRGDMVTITNQGTSRYGKVDRDGVTVTNGSTFLVANTDADGSKCFKSGATHQTGLVYFDDRGRASGVQKLNDVEILHTNDRSTQNNLDGFANLTMRIRHAAPNWAYYYAPVYVGKGSITNKIQYGVSGAFLASNETGLQGGFGANSKIYLSMRGLQGKENSYTEVYGALIDYDFAQGDRLRIVRYGDDEKVTYDFNVVGFETFDNNPETNPLLDRSSEFALNNTTGDFVILEENESATGFTIKDILNNTSNWNDSCIVEIYRENKAFDSDVYYEIGKMLPVDDTVHGTDRVTTTVNVRVTSVINNDIVAYSNQRVYKQDILQISGGPNKMTVGNVMEDDTYAAYPYKFYATVNPGSVFSVADIVMTVTNPDAVMTLNQGDSYYRLRTMFIGASPDNDDIASNAISAFTQNAIVDFVEDTRVSDFFPSAFSSVGRPFIFIPEARTMYRSGSITYSDMFVYDVRRLGLSSFNLSLQNFVDLNYEYGAVKGLVSYDDVMYFFQERRVGYLPVTRNVIEFSDGNNQITATKNVLGPHTYYSGDYGVNNNPESISAWRGTIFFVDAKAGIAFKVSPQAGLTPASEQLVSSFFSENFDYTDPTATNRQIICGVDTDNWEYLVTADAVNTSVITIDDSLTGNEATGAGRIRNGNIVATPVYDNDSTFYWNTEPREYEVCQDEWQDSGKGVLLIDTLTATQSIYLSEDLSPSILPRSASETVATLLLNIPIVLCTTAYNAFSHGTYNQATEEITPVNLGYDSTTTIGAEVETLGDFNIAYDTRKPQWNTKYSYRPERILSMNEVLYTFKEGRIYEHAETDGASNVPRCTFYGVRGDCTLQVVSNVSPSTVKAYESISIEGDSAWTCTLENQTQQSTIASGNFQEKEGFFYAYIHRDSPTIPVGNITSVESTSEIFGLGVADSASGSEITFKNPIDTITFPRGNSASLYKVSGSELVPLSVYPVSIVSQKVLNCNTTVSVSDGDVIVVLGNSAIEGDMIRDYYMKIGLSNSSTDQVQLYAINAYFSRSPLSNDTQS